MSLPERLTHCPETFTRSTKWMWDMRADSFKDMAFKGVYCGKEEIVHRFECIHKFLIEKFITKEKKVLEVGCGWGRMAKTISDCAAAYKGIDFCEDYIRQAKEGNPGLDFEVMDIRDKLPFEDLTFDIGVCISCVSSFEHNYPQIIDEIHRVCAEVLILEQEWMAWHWPLDPNYICDERRRLGK